MYKWGYINRIGKLVAPMEYDAVCRIDSVSCPLLAVAKQIGIGSDGNLELRWGFIDEKGNEITDCKYVNRRDVSYEYYMEVSKSGLMAVTVQTGTDEMGNAILEDGLINTKSEEVIPFGKYKEIYCKANSTLIQVKKQIGVDEKGDAIYKWGCIDEKENEIIPFIYESIGKFSENGLCVVQKNNDYGELKFGYINKQGKECIPFQFEYAGDFQHGLAPVKDEMGYLGFINEQGELVIPYKYYYGYGNFDQNQRAAIYQWDKDKERNDEVKYGLINTKGDEILPLQYEMIFNSLLDGYYVVKDEKYGCVDYNGKIILPTQYDKISIGTNGWIAVGVFDGKYDAYTDRYRCQYIDENGNVMLQLPQKYIEAYGFTSG